MLLDLINDLYGRSIHVIQSYVIWPECQATIYCRVRMLIRVELLTRFILRYSALRNLLFQGHIPLRPVQCGYEIIGLVTGCALNYHIMRNHNAKWSSYLEVNYFQQIYIARLHIVRSQGLGLSTTCFQYYVTTCSHSVTYYLYIYINQSV